MKKLILASASPRRREIMEKLNLEFEVIVSDSEETMDPNLSIEERVMSVARMKALNVYKNNPDCVVVGSDTIVEVDGRILGKPHNKMEAEEMISLISGRRHRVVTALAIISSEGEYLDYDAAEVHFDEIRPEAIKRYVETPEPYDKAGAYAIQGWASVYISRIEGSFLCILFSDSCRKWVIICNGGSSLCGVKAMLI